jgi:hypothetical protein
MAKEQIQPENIRVQMVQSKSVELGSSSVHYVAGEFYLLDAKTANQWIADGSAVDPLAEEVK